MKNTMLISIDKTFIRKKIYVKRQLYLFLLQLLLLPWIQTYHKQHEYNR
jgi:hypothetical protein